MAWSNSKIFSAYITNSLNRTTAFDADADTIKAALFDNTITPSQTVASASTGYGAGVWASGGVADAVSWPAAGIALSSVASGFSSNVYTFDAADTTSNDSTTDLTNVYGTLVYDDTVASDLGLCYIYLGGANTVVNGVFTIVWASGGIFSITL